MKIDRDQIKQIYSAAQSQQSNFKNLNYTERRIVEKAIKAFEKNPEKPKSFTSVVSIDISSLVQVIKGEKTKTISSTQKTFARILGAKSSDDLKNLVETGADIVELKEKGKAGDPHALLQLRDYYYLKHQKVNDKDFWVADNYNNEANQRLYEMVLTPESSPYLSNLKNDEKLFEQANAHFLLFAGRNKTHQYTAAIKNFEKVIETNPDSKFALEAHLKLCLLLTLNGSCFDVEEVKNHYQAAINLSKYETEEIKELAKEVKQNLFLAGIGLEKNEAEAFKFFSEPSKKDHSSFKSPYSKFTENRDPQRYYMLSECYKNGIGTEVNPQKWYDNLVKSATFGWGRSGDPRAKLALLHAKEEIKNLQNQGIIKTKRIDLREINL